MRTLSLLVTLSLSACGAPPEPDPDDPLYADRLGDPIPGLDADRLAAFERGREVMVRPFTPAQGLGPTFNTDSCAGCHAAPVPGGSAPRYRDFFLVKTQREDGALVDAGTNGKSPVRNLYDLAHGHTAEPVDAMIYARRNAPGFLGVGLFEFVSDREILSRQDVEDEDGDGISGKANFEQGRVGRFGYKSQASKVESFNRGAMLNQMGLTSNPLFAEFPESAGVAALGPPLLDRVLGLQTAWAQVSAPGEPTFDDDGIADPEMGDRDQMDLLTFSTYIAPPKPAARTPETRQGARLFDKAGCTACHVPALRSTIGDLPAYTDLLVHDLGDENSDGLKVALADPAEFRTAPLWGVTLQAPFLHDGSADTLEDAIEAHGGEAAESRATFRDLSASDQDLLIGFLVSLAPFDPEGHALVHPEAPAPVEGEEGGPVPGLTPDERAAFEAGQAQFDTSFALADGLGRPFFNADSCRACHQDPVLGGAGGIDTNVLRFGRWDESDVYHPVGDLPMVFRSITPGNRPVRLPAEANVVEPRQPPSLLGLGALEAIPAADVIANEDPEDTDSDGISGRARRVGGTIGRFGWKAQMPTIRDFLADAMLVEVGMTANPELSPFTGIDEDDVADPELLDPEFDLLATYIALLAPPTPAGTPEAAGSALFEATGCASCHLPKLSGVPAYTDLLLHDVAAPTAPLVDQDPDSPPGEFRTPPLWGISKTAPYLHDGLAEDLEQAILKGHFGEADASRQAYEALEQADKDRLIAFLQAL